jgi:hypothetical protein
MVMKKRDIYGFKLLDKNGIGFQRWFNGNTELVTNNLQGKLPNTLHSINIAQNVMEFNKSFIYCGCAAVEYKLRFITLTEEDWNAIEHPVKKFYKQLLKKINIWQH